MKMMLPGQAKVILQNKTGMSARSSPPKTKMWDQGELLRCWVGQRKHKSDFGQTNPILPQAQETKTHLSAMTIYSRKKPILPQAQETKAHLVHRDNLFL